MRVVPGVVRNHLHRAVAAVLEQFEPDGIRGLRLSPDPKPVLLATAKAK